LKTGSVSPQIPHRDAGIQKLGNLDNHYPLPALLFTPSKNNPKDLATPGELPHKSPAYKDSKPSTESKNAKIQPKDRVKVAAFAHMLDFARMQGFCPDDELLESKQSVSGKGTWTPKGDELRESIPLEQLKRKREDYMVNSPGKKSKFNKLCGVEGCVATPRVKRSYSCLGARRRPKPAGFASHTVSATLWREGTKRHS
jgi:hypothetical protein